MTVLRTTLARLGATLLVLLAVSAAVFFAGNALAPGSSATVLIGAEGATKAQRAKLEHQLGLDRSLATRYWDWLSGAVRGEFGTSPISQRQASDVIAQEAPISIELAVLALIIATALGVPLGVLAAIRADRAVDVGLRGVALSAFSVPVFVTGTLLVLGAAKWAPSFYQPSYVPLTEDPVANLQGMILPALTAAIPTMALLLQMTRGTLLECLSQPYVAVADARGISPRRLYFVHALKNAVPPILTFQGFQFGILLGSLFIVEQVFSLPGLGRGVIADINNRDFTLVEAEVMVIAAAFVVGNLIVDLLDPIVDPRKRAA